MSVTISYVEFTTKVIGYMFEVKTISLIQLTYPYVKIPQPKIVFKVPSQDAKLWSDTILLNPTFQFIKGFFLLQAFLNFSSKVLETLTGFNLACQASC